MSDVISTIGKLLEGEHHRDAIHVAIVPLVAAHDMDRGCRFDINAEGKAFRTFHRKFVGIVDPFLDTRMGEQFWGFMCPGSITSIRHDWTHPAFARQLKTSDADSKQESGRWLESYASKLGTEFETLIVDMSQMESDGCLNDDCDYYGDITSEAWDHWENVTGLKATNRPEYFRCAC